MVFTQRESSYFPIIMKHLFLSLMFVCAALLVGCSTTSLNTTAKIVNFERVSTNLYRSGQLTTSNQWYYVASLGVKKTIKLNTDAEGSDSMATNFGIKVIYLPMPPSGITDWWKGPDKDKYFQAIIEIRKSLNNGEGVLIHCTHGQDRTGIVMGGADIYILHKSKKEAWQNMIEHHYHVIFLGLDCFWNRLPSYF